jgi:hypothetical protein
MFAKKKAVDLNGNFQFKCNPGSQGNREGSRGKFTWSLSSMSGKGKTGGKRSGK